MNYFVKKYNIDLKDGLPTEILNVGRDDLANLFRELDFKIDAEIAEYLGVKINAEVRYKRGRSLNG